MSAHKVVIVPAYGGERVELWLCRLDDKGIYLPICGPLKVPDDWALELERKPTPAAATDTQSVGRSQPHGSAPRLSGAAPTAGRK